MDPSRRHDQRSEGGHLVLVGAAAGYGRWLLEHVLMTRAWDEVTLIDTESSSKGLEVAASQFALPVQVGFFSTGSRAAEVRSFRTDEVISLVTGTPTVLVAVPSNVRPTVLGRLQECLPSDVQVGVVAGTMSASLSDVTSRWPTGQCFVVHPLVDLSARSIAGQTVLFGSADSAGETSWLEALVAAAGGLVRSVNADEHDAVMSYVQTMTHQVLLDFAGAMTAAPVSLDLAWELRTPLFEALFGLVARILSESRQATISDIQLSLDGLRVADELARAAERTRRAIETGSSDEVSRLIANARDEFSGALFDSVQKTASVEMEAAQSKRSELARRLATSQLVGLHIAGQESLRVAEILSVTSTSVELREVLLGKKGRAALAHGPGAANARRLGVSGKPRVTTVSLGKVELVTDDDLDRELDGWLGSLARDIRLLVPESVSGDGVLSVVAEQAGVRSAALVSEVVRTGQRSVVVRIEVRADRDIEATVSAVRDHVEKTYAWPRGLSLPALNATSICFLGPTGTFSESAARQAGEISGIGLASLLPCETFDDVLNRTNEGSLAVLPVASSASGAVGRALDAILEHDRPLEAGGVVDVAVRFDAYVRSDSRLADLRGAPAFSHPQALAQCSNFISRWDLRPHPCASTTEALRLVAEGSTPGVALAAAGAEAVHGMILAEQEVDDLSGSITRFLILGRTGSFDELEGGSLPTLRSIWAARTFAAAVRSAACLPASGFDEFLTAESGACLWVTSRSVTADSEPELRDLGRAPWTPRTPLVRVADGP